MSVVGSGEWTEAQVAGYEGPVFTRAGKLDGRARAYLADRVWERVEELYRWRFPKFSPWKMATGEVPSLTGGHSEIQLPDHVYERQVVNRGLRRLRRKDAGLYLVLCTVVRNGRYEEREFTKAKKGLAAEILDFSRILPQVPLTVCV